MLEEIRSIVRAEISEQVHQLKDAIIGELDEFKCIINKKIADLESSVEFAYSSVEELKSTVDAKLKSHEVKLKEQVHELQAKINNLERHCRSYNLRINRVTETREENCFDIVANLMEDLGLGYEASQEIENAHRTGKRVRNWPRQIIVKFYSRPFKHRVLNAAKQKRNDPEFTARFVEDFTPEDYKKRQSAIPLMTQAMREGNKATFRNGHLIINDNVVKM